MSQQIEEVSVLKLSLHGRLVGYLAGFQNGRNVLSFADEFKNDPARALWPNALKDLPMDEEHKSKLKEHWLKLHSDFRIAF